MSEITIETWLLLVPAAAIVGALIYVLRRKRHLGSYDNERRFKERRSGDRRRNSHRRNPLRRKHDDNHNDERRASDRREAERRQGADPGTTGWKSEYKNLKKKVEENQEDEAEL